MMGNSYNQFGYNQYPNMQNQQMMQSYTDRLNQYQNQIQQMQPQQQFNQIQSQQQGSNIDFPIVANKEQAKNMIVQPNQTMWSRDSIEPKLYVKTVSNTGIAEFHSYVLVEEKETVEEQTDKTNEIDLSGYVSIEYFNDAVTELKNKLMEYDKKLSELAKPKTTTPSTRKEGVK